MVKYLLGILFICRSHFRFGFYSRSDWISEVSKFFVYIKYMYHGYTFRYRYFFPRFGYGFSNKILRLCKILDFLEKYFGYSAKISGVQVGFYIKLVYFQIFKYFRVFGF